MLARAAAQIKWQISAIDILGRAQARRDKSGACPCVSCTVCGSTNLDMTLRKDFAGGVNSFSPVVMHWQLSKAGPYRQAISVRELVALVDSSARTNQSFSGLHCSSRESIATERSSKNWCCSQHLQLTLSLATHLGVRLIIELDLSLLCPARTLFTLFCECITN